MALVDKYSDKTTNTCFVIDKTGEIIHRYDKKYMYQVNKKGIIIDETQDTIPGKANGVFTFSF